MTHTPRSRFFAIIGAQSLPIVLSLLVAFALFNIDQLTDLLRETDENPNKIPYFISVTYFCLIIWFTCRWTLLKCKTELQLFPKDYESDEGVKQITEDLRHWTPRAVPMVFLLLVIAYSFKEKFYMIAVYTAIVMIILQIIFYSLHRYELNRKAKNDTQSKEHVKSIDEFEDKNLRNKLESVLAVFVLLIFILSTFIALFYTVYFAEIFSGLGVLFVGLGSVVYGGTLVVYYLLAHVINVPLRLLSLITFFISRNVQRFAIYIEQKVFKDPAQRASFIPIKDKQLFVIRKPYPVTSLLLVTALIVSIILPSGSSHNWHTDNHAYRSVLQTYADKPSATQAGKISRDYCTLSTNNYGRAFCSVDDVFDVFVQNKNKTVVTKEKSNKQIIPMYFVVNQGGGLRASYWSNAHLSKLSEQLSNFNENLFMMSGASGGTVGNFMHLSTLLISRETGCGSSHECAKKMHSADFLSPVVTSFLYNDLLYRFLPIGLFSKDRAVHLEESFETGFLNTYMKEGEKNPLKTPYQSVYQESIKENKWLPIVAGTTTIQELGTLAVTLPYPMSPTDYPSLYDLPLLNAFHSNHERLLKECIVSAKEKKLIHEKGVDDSSDCFDPTPELTAWRSTPTFKKEHFKDTSLITTAINSARFPYITPVGSIDSDVEWTRKLHTADAGYFDNYGAIVVKRTLQALEKRILDMQKEGQYYIPILIIFRNSPEKQFFNGQKPKRLDKQLVNEFTSYQPNTKYKSWAFNEITAPIQGLASVRGGHAEENLIDLINYSETVFKSKFIRELGEYQDTYFHAFTTSPGENDPPLGWWLSHDSQQPMDDQAENNIKSMIIQISTDLNSN